MFFTELERIRRDRRFLRQMKEEVICMMQDSLSSINLSPCHSVVVTGSSYALNIQHVRIFRSQNRQLFCAM